MDTDNASTWFLSDDILLAVQDLSRVRNLKEQKVFVERVFGIVIMLQDKMPASCKLDLKDRQAYIDQAVGLINGSTWWKETRGWGQVFSVLLALRALLEDDTQVDFCEQIVEGATRQNDDLRTKMWNRNTSIPLEDVERKDISAEAKWRQAHAYCMDPRSTGASDTSATLRKTVAVAFEKTCTLFKKENLGPQHVWSKVARIPVPPGRKTAAMQRDEERKQAAKSVLRGEDDDGFDICPVNEGPEDSDHDPVARAFKKQRKEEDKKEEEEEEKEKSVSDTASEEEDGNAQLETQNHPMSEEMWQELSQIHAFKEMNGHTYKQYLRKWKGSVKGCVPDWVQECIDQPTVFDAEWDARGIDLFEADHEELERRNEEFQGDDYVPTPTPVHHGERMEGKFYKWWLGDALKYYPVVHDDRHPRRDGWSLDSTGTWGIASLGYGPQRGLSEKYLKAAEDRDQPEVLHKRLFAQMVRQVQGMTQDVAGRANHALGAPRELALHEQKLVIYKALLEAQEEATRQAKNWFDNEITPHVRSLKRSR